MGNITNQMSSHDLETSPTSKEDDFWDIFFSYLPNEKLSFAIAFCKYGNQANKDINYFVFNVKYDF